MGGGPIIALVAGEASGDLLGAGLIEALGARLPGARFVGVAGPRMQAAGCESWYSTDALSVMGLAEVLRHLPRLVALRRDLVARLLELGPDVFVGIDAPDFNLGLARKLHRRGLRTVQYVSPQLWAWRPRRVHTIRESMDRVLCLLPFETEFYGRHGVDARFVGHPLANTLPLEPDRAAARAAFGLADDVPVLAVLPGSRRAEVGQLALPFAGAVERLGHRIRQLRVLVPVAHEGLEAPIRSAFATAAPGADFELVANGARQALAAADVALVASGTATLETALSKTPMVVAYRLAGATWHLLRALDMVKVEHVALPNLLAGRSLVPELLQNDVTPERLAEALHAMFTDPERRSRLESEFAKIHRVLRRDASAGAAAAVAELIGAA